MSGAIYYIEKERIMDLLQLKYFQDAASTENFSKTAAKYMVPPSCVSLYIKKLETELGVKLFDRTANRIQLNENGKLFLTAVNHAFNELDTARNKLSNNSGIPSGEISLLIETNRKTITEHIAAFKKEYPQVSFRIEHKKTNKYSDFDIVITDQHVDSTLFDGRVIIKEAFKLALCTSHPLASSKVVDLADLKDARFISMPKGHSMREFAETLCALYGFSPNVSIECDDPYYIREYIGMEMGVALVPEHSWRGQYPDNVVLKDLSGKQLVRETKVYVKRNGLQIAELFAKRL